MENYNQKNGRYEAKGTQKPYGEERKKSSFTRGDELKGQKNSNLHQQDKNKR